MDIGILTINDWYEWVGVYIAGMLPGAMAVGRVWAKSENYWNTDSGKALLVSDWDEGPPPSFGAFVWPVSLPIALAFLIAYKIDNANVKFNRVIYGKPPKQVKEKARTRMLEIADSVMDE